MKYENLTHSQKSIYDKLEKEIKDSINDTENKIKGVSEIEFFPKKDGTEKENFSLNFGLKNYGVSYKAERWGKRENIHPVNIYLDYGYSRMYNSKPTGVKILVAPVFDYEKREYLNNFKYFDDSIYFSCSDVKNFLGFDVSEEPQKLTAKKVFELITIYYKNMLSERLENYKEELKQLPELFEKSIEISNYLIKEVGKTSKFSHIHNFYYNNFENKDVYFLCNLKNK